MFLLRVVAQPLALTGIGPLPPFEAWHSGVMPYGVLLASQLVIAGVLLVVAWRMSQNLVTARRRVGVVALAAGAVYFGTMIGRLVLGATALRDHGWFARPLPTIFHLVLAGFLLVYGHFHFRYGAK